MAEFISKEKGTESGLERIFILQEKRRSPRKELCSFVSAEIPSTRIDGAGSDASQTGMYFVTSDDLPVEVCIQGPGGERRVRGRIVRIDAVSDGTVGIAVAFDVRQRDL